MQSASGRSAVVLLSGGLDSTTVLAIARESGYRCHAMSFRYGQRHAIELDRARVVAATLGAESHIVVDIDLRQFGGSSLTADIPVPKHACVAEMDPGVPSTYVPARNTIFLSLAVARAETLGATDIFIGVNALDYSGYPDCRPDFIAAFERMANLGTKAGIEGERTLRIRTPLIAMSKSDIVRRGLALGVDFGLTTSCYDPHPITGAPCRHCDSCLLRRKGFVEAGVVDPLDAVTP